MAAEYGMTFLRVGSNVTEVERMQPYIERAKKYSMYVSANLMKSYAIEPLEYAETACLTQKFGADLLCIVDSAGGMLTEQMEAYFRAVQDTCDIPLGFHGHNNLQLAVANSLRAVDLGAKVIDTSMLGFGRSAGNTASEVFLLALERKGIRLGINPLQVMDVSEKYIKPLINRELFGFYSGIDVTL